MRYLLSSLVSSIAAFSLIGTGLVAHADTTAQNNRAVVLQWASAHHDLNEFTNSPTMPKQGVSPLGVIGPGHDDYPGTSIPCEPGDVLISSDTQYDTGITGHAAIVIDTEGDVAQIRGLGYHPEFTSISSFWSGNNGQIMVKRYPNSTDRNDAANWATSLVDNQSSMQYKFSPIWITTTAAGTYCSKLVWDSFYFGAGVMLNFELGPIRNQDVCLPYDLSSDSSMSTLYNHM